MRLLLKSSSSHHIWLCNALSSTNCIDKLYLQTLEGWENDRAQKEQLMQAMVKLYTVVLTFISRAIQRLRMNTHETADLNTDTYFLKMAEEKFDVDEIASKIESECHFPWQDIQSTYTSARCPKHQTLATTF
jgi:hypothetical protein